MAIDRTPWTALVDDDGSNLVGTVWNKDKIKTVILDPVDAAFKSPASGTWAPADKSGAGLALSVTGALYWKLDRLVVIQVALSYPVTSNTARAEIGDLPFANGPVYGGLYATVAAQMFQLSIAPGSVRFFVNSSSGGALTNQNLSGAVVFFAGVYLTA